MIHSGIAVCLSLVVLLVCRYLPSPNICFDNVRIDVSYLYSYQIILFLVLLAGIVIQMITTEISTTREISKTNIQKTTEICKKRSNVVDIIKKSYPILCVSLAFVASFTLLWPILLKSKCVENKLLLAGDYPHMVVFTDIFCMFFLLIVSILEYRECSKKEERNRNSEEEKRIISTTGNIGTVPIHLFAEEV